MIGDISDVDGELSQLSFNWFLLNFLRIVM
jgi:hypothetical protein